MEMKQLGNTAVMVSEIGLGTSRYHGGDEPLRRGIALGATFVDCAEMYGNEYEVGRALRGLRERVFLATKVLDTHLHYDLVIRAAELSMRRLDVDCIDLYQIHLPNRSVPIAETMGAMEALVDAGLIRYIGVSNFSTADLREAQAVMTNNPIVSNQVLYNLKARAIEDELLPYCQQNNITVIAYSPLAEGSLVSKSRLWPERRMRVMGQVAAQVNKTLAQVALNWCTSRPNVIAIPKSNSVAKTEENCGASGWRLSPEQVRVLDEAFK